MRQTYLSLGGGPRVLKAIAFSPKFAAGSSRAAVQQRQGRGVKELGGLPGGLF